MNLVREISDLIADSILSCVFGQSNLERRLPYVDKGKTSSITIGNYVKVVIIQTVKRAFNPLRMMFNIFDTMTIG